MPVDSFSFNIVPRERGGLYFTEDGGTVRGVAVQTPGPETVQAWQSHFGTCPELQWEKDRKAGEDWNETQERIEREKKEKIEAAEAEKEARKRERMEREEKQREFEEAQMGFADFARGENGGGAC